MTASEYADHMFGVATGWLGWTPDVALRTPIPQIELALKARVDWIRKSNGETEPEGVGNKVARVMRSIGR